MELEWDYTDDERDTILGRVDGHGFSIVGLRSSPMLAFGEWGATVSWLRPRHDPPGEVTLDGHGSMDPVPWLTHASGSVAPDTARAEVQQGDDVTDVVLVPEQGTGRALWIGFFRNDSDEPETLVTFDADGRELARHDLRIGERERRIAALEAENEAIERDATWRDGLLPELGPGWAVKYVRRGQVERQRGQFSGLDVHLRRGHPIAEVVVALEWWRDLDAEWGPRVFEHRLRNLVSDLQMNGHLTELELASRARWLAERSQDETTEPSLESETERRLDVAGRSVPSRRLVVDGVPVVSVAIAWSEDLEVEIVAWGIDPDEVATHFVPVTGEQLGEFVQRHPR